MGGTRRRSTARLSLMPTFSRSSPRTGRRPLGEDRAVARAVEQLRVAADGGDVPPQSSAARSASDTVDGRCTTTNAVTPSSTRRSAASTCASVCTSSADSGSSSTITSGPAEDRAGRGRCAGVGPRQRHALLADAGVEAPRQVVHELACAMRSASSTSSSVAPGFPSGGVLAYAGGEERRLLEAHRDMAAQRAQGDVAHVDDRRW